MAWEETFCAAAYFVALENVGPFSVLQLRVTMMMRRAEARADALSLGLLATPLGAALLAEDKPEAAVRFLDGQLARSPDDLDLRTWGLIVRRIDAFLYQDAGLQAYRAVEDMWPRFESSDYARTPFVEMFTRMRRAHAALAAFRERPDTALQGIAVADARRLERMQRQDATIVAHGIRAAIAVQKGRHPEAAERLRAADSLSQEAGVYFAATCYRLQLGRVMPSPTGPAIQHAAARELRYGEGAVTPRRREGVRLQDFEEAAGPAALQALLAEGSAVESDAIRGAPHRAAAGRERRRGGVAAGLESP